MKTVLVRYKWEFALICIIGLYLLTHILMLLLSGVYWDDLYVWFYSNDVIDDNFGVNKANNPFVLFMIQLFIRNDNPIEYNMLLYKIYPFFTGLITLITSFYIIKKITSNFAITFLTSAIFSVSMIDKTLPVFVCCTYATSLMLTILGLWFFVSDYYKGNIICKFITAFLWLVAMFIWRTPVTVIPFFIFIASLLKVKINWKSISSYKELVGFAIREYWMIIISYLLSVFIFETYLSPKGWFAEYYSIPTINALLSPITAVLSSSSLFFQFISSIVNTIGSSGSFFVVQIVIFIVLYISLNKLNWQETYYNKKLFYIIVAFYYFAIFPHMLSHDLVLVKDFSKWHTRLTSMAALPISFLVAYMIQLIKPQIRNILLAIFFVSSLSISYRVFNGYCVGWARYEAITSFFESNKYLEGKKITYIYNAGEFSEFDMDILRFYEIGGCAKIAYGKDSKTDFCDYFDKMHVIDPDYYLIIQKNRNFNYSRSALLLKKLLNKGSYDIFVKNMLEIKVFSKEEYESK